MQRVGVLNLRRGKLPVARWAGSGGGARGQGVVYVRGGVGGWGSKRRGGEGREREGTGTFPSRSNFSHGSKGLPPPLEGADKRPYASRPIRAPIPCPPSNRVTPPDGSHAAITPAFRFRREFEKPASAEGKPKRPLWRDSTMPLFWRVSSGSNQASCEKLN